MTIKTVGDLRKLIADLPDEMEVLEEFGSNIAEVVSDYADDCPQPAGLSGSVETRCDDIPHLYLCIEGIIPADVRNQEN